MWVRFCSWGLAFHKNSTRQICIPVATFDISSIQSSSLVPLKPLSSIVNRHIQRLVCFSQISQPVRFFGRPNTTSTWFNSRVLTKQTYPSVLGHIFHLCRPTRQRSIDDAPSKNLSNQPIYGPIGKLRAIRNLVSLRVWRLDTWFWLSDTTQSFFRLGTFSGNRGILGRSQRTGIRNPHRQRNKRCNTDNCPIILCNQNKMLAAYDWRTHKPVQEFHPRYYWNRLESRLWTNGNGKCDVEYRYGKASRVLGKNNP